MTQAEMSDAISGELAFDVFASESPAAHKQKALKALMREKLIPKQADDARFQAGLASLTRVAADRSEESESRLLAIACVVHSAQVVKRLQPSLQQWLAVGAAARRPWPGPRAGWRKPQAAGAGSADRDPVQASATAGDRPARAARRRSRAAADPRFLAPGAPDDNLWRAARSGGEASCVDRSGELLTILALVDLPGRDEVLLGRFALDNEIATLAQTIEKHYYDYQQLAFLRGALKYTLSVVLSVVLVAAVLFALYLAFALARGLVDPLRRLVQATRAVAQGDYRISVPEISDDELGGLARAFNQMARELDEAKERLLRAAGDAEAGRRYFEGVLDRISSGVLSLDGAGRLRTSNGSAQEILGVDLSPWNGLAIERLGKAYPPLQPLVQRLVDALAREPGDWREEVRIQRGQQEQRLLLGGARLPGGDGEVGGLVLVFDDESEYARATRDSAWSEVARRLAHEIKNPLTPIQLAAERRRKFLERLPEADREILDRSTHTIVAQVEALKAMVNAFSDYARPPRLELKPVRLSKVMREVVDLYIGEAARIDIHLRIPDDEPPVRADMEEQLALANSKDFVNLMEGIPVSKANRAAITAELLPELKR